MRTLLIVLVLCGIAGLLTATISNSIIESDSMDLTQLYEEFKSLAPQSARQAAESTCQMVDQCCPQQQMNFLQSAMSGQGEKFAELCFGQQNSNDFMTRIMSCKPLQNMASLASDSQFLKFVEANKEKSSGDQPNMQVMLRVCSPDELLALACDWNEVIKHASCQRKMLQEFANQGDNIYTERVERLKNEGRKFNSRIRNVISG